MDIWEASKLALFIWFVVPGFISIKVYQLIVPASYRSTSELLIDAVSYSCINFALMSWAVVYVEGSGLFSAHRWMYYAFYFFVLFVSPVLIVLLWKKIRTSDRFQWTMPHPTLKPWDFVFSNRSHYWVHVHLVDGGSVSGLYSSRSFASSAPATDQIYLEQVWVLNEDGGFDRMVEGSAGAIISGDRIKYVEFIDYEG
ncbi:DUF6338 family protein [Pseudomonas peradeniyensis]|uniref:DUF6338 family protein n=1 Tax=Pseudomonas peradeniyensis TaxID=2745488 RepID=UPI003C6E755A